MGGTMSEPVLWFAKSDDGVSSLRDVRETREN
jgi:hypothetical protein